MTRKCEREKDHSVTIFHNRKFKPLISLPGFCICNNKKFYSFWITSISMQSPNCPVKWLFSVSSSKLNPFVSIHTQSNKTKKYICKLYQLAYHKICQIGTLCYHHSFFLLGLYFLFVLLFYRFIAEIYFEILLKKSRLFICWRLFTT